MEFTVENISNLERRIKVSIPAIEIDTKTEKKLNELTKKVKLQGFRPGKVPLSVVKQRFGKDARQEILADAIQTSYFEVLDKEKLRPAGQPKIEPQESDFGKPLEYVATFEVYPEIKLHSLAGVKVEKLKSEVTDKNLDDMLERLRKQRAEWKEVKRAAKTGDQLEIDFEGSIKGEKFEGGSSKNFKLELGVGSMLEGFEKPLIGAKAGDEVELKVKFPKDYHGKDVAGKKAEFVVKVHKISESKLPEVNAKFLEQMGIKKGGIEELRKKMRTNMEQQLAQAETKKFKDKVMDKLLKLNPIEVPKVLVENEIARLQQQAKQQFIQYTGRKEADVPDLPREEFAENAKKRVTLGLLLAKMVEQDNLKADPAKVKAKIEELAKGYKDSAEVVKWYYNNKEYMAEIESLVLEEQTFDKLYKEIQPEEKQVSYEEIVNA